MSKIEDLILFQIDQTSKVSKQYSQREFDKLEFGITVEQWIILKIISENKTLSQKELAKKSFRDPASITRTLDLLEKKEFLIREPIPNNRRAYNVRLTSTGSEFIDRNMKTVQQHRELSIQNITAEDLKKLSETLEIIRNNMK